MRRQTHSSRWLTLRLPAAVGALLCQQFTFNAGEQYKHVVGAKTYPFAPEETEPPVASPSATTYAPACAKAGRDHLSAVVHSLKGSAYDAFPDFNEILSVAYSEYELVLARVLELTLDFRRSDGRPHECAP